MALQVKHTISTTEATGARLADLHYRCLNMLDNMDAEERASDHVKVCTQALLTDLRLLKRAHDVYVQHSNTNLPQEKGVPTYDATG